jgi:hypothetical protein
MRQGTGVDEGFDRARHGEWSGGRQKGGTNGKQRRKRRLNEPLQARGGFARKGRMASVTLERQRFTPILTAQTCVL